MVPWPAAYCLCLVLLAVLSATEVLGRRCPCADEKLCKPITGQPPWQVFAFSGSATNWPLYDWDVVTTVALYRGLNDSLMCHAHQHGVRVVQLVDLPKSALLTSAGRKVYIDKWMGAVQDHFLDGINVDFEQSTQQSETGVIQGLNLLMQELRQRLNNVSRHLQLTFDTPWAPDCASERCYDYVNMSKQVDFFFVMDYDLQDLTKPLWQASSQSPLPMNLQGMQKFEAHGISAHQLLMGLPWYGQDSVCKPLTQDNRCRTEGKRKAYCYSQIISKLHPHRTSDVMWDDEAKATYFNHKDAAGKEHQIWYDDPRSIKVKVKAAGSAGMRGVGMWQADCVDYSNKTQIKQMWGSMATPN